MPDQACGIVPILQIDWPAVANLQPSAAKHLTVVLLGVVSFLFFIFAEIDCQTRVSLPCQGNVSYYKIIEVNS